MFTSFFFNDTATTEIYTLSLHDALPIFLGIDPLARTTGPRRRRHRARRRYRCRATHRYSRERDPARRQRRSEEHTSELQSRQYLVCRLLLEKKKNTHKDYLRKGLNINDK